MANYVSGRAEKICGIYRIVHRATGKSYVGQSIDIYQRWRRHMHRLKAEPHIGGIYDAMREEGIEAFSLEILEVCDRSALNEREVHWIDKLDSCERGFNDSRGVKLSDRAKEKIRQSRLGRSFGPLSAEHRAAIGKAHRGRPKPSSRDVIQKVNAARKARSLALSGEFMAE